MKERLLLAECIRILRRYRRPLVAMTFIPTLVVVMGSYFWPKTYEVKFTLIPTESQNQGLGTMMGGAGGATLFTGLLKGFNGVDNTDKLQFILESYSLARNVIQDLKLEPILFPDKWDKAKQAWINPETSPKMDDAVGRFRKKVMLVKADKRGLITVKVRMRDREVATQTATKIAESLQAYINNNVLTLGKKNRIFVEEQLTKNEQELAVAEQQLREYEQKNKIYDISSQTEMTLGLYSSLNSEIIKNEAQMAQIANLYGKDNSQYQNLQLKNRTLRDQLNKIQANSKVGGRNLIGELDSVPKVKLEYMHLKRDVIVLEKVFSFLKEQYEIAKINELRDEISFQLIDPPHRPDYHAWPKKKLLAVLSLIGFFLTGFLAIFIRETIATDIQRELKLIERVDA